MQTLPLQLTTTFIDDAISLIRGPGEVIVHLVTAPIERIADACDVGGVLARRRERARLKATHRGRWPFGALSELT